MFYTDINQSKHLLELGLKADTADMLHLNNVGKFGKVDGTNCATILKKNFNSLAEIPEIIPCWSVGALLELMPKEIEDDNKNTCWFGFVAYNQEWYVYYTGDGFSIVEYKGNDIMKLLYNMTVWLLQNNYIKTE